MNMETRFSQFWGCDSKVDDDVFCLWILLDGFAQYVCVNGYVCHLGVNQCRSNGFSVAFDCGQLQVFVSAVVE